MSWIRRIPPLLLIAALAAGAAVGAVGVLPFVSVSTPETPLLGPPVIEPIPPQYCLSPLPVHFYGNNPADKKLAGPGNLAHKESNNAFGPSAVVADREGLTEERRFEEVKHEFVRRHCGDGSTGGDSKLFQVGFVGSDVHNLTAAPTHPHMNPNTPISRSDWEVGLEAYMAAIVWEQSSLVYEKLGPNTWTLSMVPQPGQEPLVKLIQHEQPASWYLMLAVRQPDGSVAMERRRLECGFQPTYTSYEEVPAAFR